MAKETKILILVRFFFYKSFNQNQTRLKIEQKLYPVIHHGGSKKIFLSSGNPKTPYQKTSQFGSNFRVGIRATRTIGTKLLTRQIYLKLR